MGSPAIGPTPWIIFVCHGNICRSPMAEMVARKRAADAGLAATFTSAGISNEEDGNPIDRRAERTLKENGYPVDPHRPHRITQREIESADLIVAAEPYHIERMKRLAPGANNFRLITDFDPTAPVGSAIPDPWYGPLAGFSTTLDSIESAMDGLLDWIRDFHQN